MKRCIILFLLVFPGILSAAVEPLVTPSWLHSNRDNSNLVLLDLQDNQNYQRFHVPGSINTNYADWRVEKTGQLKNIPTVSVLEKLIGSLGVDNNSHVVLISLGTSAGDMAAAARIYWTFKVLGHDNISILDGGLVGYAKDRVYPLEKGNNQRKPAKFTANYRKQMNPNANEVKTALNNGTQIVDNRSEAEYLGIYGGDGKERAGRLPKALHLNYDWLTVNGSGKLHSVENLQRIYAASKVALNGDQINYCHTGNRAALGWFVSHEILGNRQAKLYDGSIQEWAANPSLPMEQQVKLSY
jgi:thiosulfate/3-mercaptopyruvate sulfurtransferase